MCPVDNKRVSYTTTIDIVMVISEEKEDSLHTQLKRLLNAAEHNRLKLSLDSLECHEVRDFAFLTNDNVLSLSKILQRKVFSLVEFLRRG